MMSGAPWSMARATRGVRDMQTHTHPADGPGTDHAPSELRPREAWVGPVVHRPRTRPLLHHPQARSVSPERVVSITGQREGRHFAALARTRHQQVRPHELKCGHLAQRQPQVQHAR